MALDGTYAGLQASVADWLNRADLTAQIPDFIALVDARLNNDLRLRLQEVEASLTTTAGSRQIPLPANFNEALGFWLVWPWGRQPMRFYPAAELPVEGYSRQPSRWTIDGANIMLSAPADDTYSMILRMMQAYSLAGSSAAAMYVLQTYPTLYLYGALLEAEPFLREDSRVQLWEGKFTQALALAQEKEGRSRSLGTLSVDPALTKHKWDEVNYFGPYGRFG